jgi:DNA-binding transcriptional regulator LsrR (DeoR family)
LGAKKVSEVGAKPRVRREPQLPPVEFADPLIWVAWLYYEEHLTQEQTAQVLGVSRATVANLLQEAREVGVVTIAVAPQHLRSVGMAREICQRFDLAECLVVPNDRGLNPPHERVGRAAARLLADRLEKDDVLGVSWGRTILALSEAMTAMDLPSVTVVQITGSATSRYGFSAELCASNIANRIRGRCVYLHAPGVVSHRDVKSMLIREPTLIEQFEVARGCTRIVFGVGGVTSTSTAFSSGFLREIDAEPYIEKGAVAMLAGLFLDKAGSPVLGDLDDRMIGLTVDEIHLIPDRICAAAGEDKVEPIRALLVGGHITTLVTDEITAELLLGHERRKV